MGYVIDLSGKKFGRLLVIEQVKQRTSNRQVKWKCLCDCGNTVYPLGNGLKRGSTKSCGCLSRDSSRERNSTHGQNRRDGKRTAEYRVWSNMKYRCFNPNYKEFHYYGGRGITVCERWLKFENFYEDMGKRPSPKHSLDRCPNVNGNYEPSNCRWATTHEQANCKRNNVWIEYNGVKKTKAQWANFFSIKAQDLQKALSCKTFEEAYNFYVNTIDKKEATRQLITSKQRVLLKNTVYKIRSDFPNGVRQCELVKRYNVSKHVIYNITHNKSYIY